MFPFLRRKSKIDIENILLVSIENNSLHVNELYF